MLFRVFFAAVDVFGTELITRSVLKKIIEHPGVIEEKDSAEDNETAYLYKNGVHSDFFSLILQGRIEVVVGIENIVFEDGPFSVFGVNALLCESGQHFLPDYAVKVITHIQYLKVSRSLYRSAVRASKMEKENKTPDIYQEYDEIFWTHLNKTSENESPGIGIASTKSDRSSLRSRGSMRSNENEGGTPSKLSHKRKSSFLNKLTPKFDRKRNSPTPEVTPANARRKERNQLSNSSQENPLMGNENEETGELLVDTCSVSSDTHA